MFAYEMMFVFLALFPILNPPAMAPIFLKLTAGVSDPERYRLATLIGIYTFLLLTTLLFVGGWFLKLMGISMPVISIAGGLLLFHSAWRMLNNEPRDEAEAAAEETMLHKAFFPLTMPVTAGPGSMAVTLSLVPDGKFLDYATILQFVAVTCGIALAALAVYIFYRFSGPLLRKLGPTGSATISQISAFVLLAVGVQIVWNGISQLLKTLP